MVSLTTNIQDKLPLGVFIHHSHQKWKYMMSQDKKYIRAEHKYYKVMETWVEKNYKINVPMFPTTSHWTIFFQENDSSK